MAKFVKQPAKIGDKVIMFGGPLLAFTEYKPYRIVATQNSQPKNREAFGIVYPLVNKKRKDHFGIFVLDDNGDKRFIRLGTDCFGITVEKLCEQNKTVARSESNL